MALRMEWSIVGPFSGLAGQSVRDVEDAVWWVNDTVTQIREYANLTPLSPSSSARARGSCAPGCSTKQTVRRLAVSSGRPLSALSA